MLLGPGNATPISSFSLDYHHHPLPPPTCNELEALSVLLLLKLLGVCVLWSVLKLTQLKTDRMEMHADLKEITKPPRAEAREFLWVDKFVM